jgi:hypothetical protein
MRKPFMLSLSKYERTVSHFRRGLRLLLSSLPFPWHTKKSGRQGESFEEEAAGVDLPQCHKCGPGVLVPLSDFGPRGAALEYKVWACINPTCGFTIRIDKGVVIYGRKVSDSRQRIDEP